MAQIDGEEFEVAAGDFMGFPTPAVAHHLRNPYDEDLVYRVGGENHEVEVADFPRLGKRTLRLGQNVEAYTWPTPEISVSSKKRPIQSRSTSVCGRTR